MKTPALFINEFMQLLRMLTPYIVVTNIYKKDEHGVSTGAVDGSVVTLDTALFRDEAKLREFFNAYDQFRLIYSHRGMTSVWKNLDREVNPEIAQDDLDAIVNSGFEMMKALGVDTREPLAIAQ